MSGNDERGIGLFSTVPVEFVFAAGATPVDLNNRFVAGKGARGALLRADRDRLPRTTCAWTRGLYGAALEGGIKEVVAVTHGDCAMNGMMAELLESQGVHVHRFDYPAQDYSSPSAMARELQRFAQSLGTDYKAVTDVAALVGTIRQDLAELDRLNWEEGRGAAEAVRLALLQSTDFNGNLKQYAAWLKALLSCHRKMARQDGPRLALFGVPNASTNLVETLETLNANVVHFEAEYDFAMLPPVDDLVLQYDRLAYPRGIHRRADRFLEACRQRNVDGVVVYQQEFCHHNVEQRSLMERLGNIPYVVVEADEPGPLASRDRLRLEAFMERFAKRPKGHFPQMTVQVGLDVGSRFAKGMALLEQKVHSARIDTIQFFRKFVQRSPKLAAPALHPEAILDWLGIDNQDARDVEFATTGYGRHLLGLSNSRVLSEIQAHASGAVHQTGQLNFVLLDLGGQDSKVIRLSNGRVGEFVMNDKCAAGGGRYVENMARLLDIPLEAVLQVDAEPVALTNVCATFGESEVIGHLMDATSLEQISAGILASVADRSVQLLNRIGGLKKGERLFLSGGLAGSTTLQRFLSQRLDGVPVEALDEPYANGALGCLLELGGKVPTSPPEHG